MAIGDKYSALTRWLLNCGLDSVSFTFEKLSKIIPLSDSAYLYEAIWANTKKLQSFNAGWLRAGYVVSQLNLEKQMVVFSKKGLPIEVSQTKPIRKSKYYTVSENMLSEIIESGYFCYDSMGNDIHHRYMSWEHCHKVFKENKGTQDDSTIDYLCLHLAWYLASWGMLRNSFLQQKDYRIHAPVVRLLMQPQWDDLWDITAEHLAQERYAKKIVFLCNEITRIYKETANGNATSTLLSKILLGTIGCTPAYDRYFKKAVSKTQAASQLLNEKSLMALGELYIAYKKQFEVLRNHCSERIEYPVAKIIDMCFFQYGLGLSGVEQPEDE